MSCGVLWATPAVGQELREDGNELLSYCEVNLEIDVTRLAESGYCIGLVAGVQYVSELPDTPSYRRVCRPPGATLGQSVRVAYNWLEDHPERLHENNSILIVEALREAFPCSE